MAGGITTVGANLMLNLLLGAAVSAPGTLYVGLATSEPSTSTTGTSVAEPSGGSYARVAVTNNATSFPAAANGSKKNATTVAFPTATADWGVVRHWIICDASTGGTLICWGKLSNPLDVASGATVSLGPDDMDARIIAA